MGDPWKSVTPKGVSAFVNASTSVILFWIAFESSLTTVLGIHIAYIVVLASLISAYLLRNIGGYDDCLLYTSPSPRDKRQSRMPSSA